MLQAVQLMIVPPNSLPVRGNGVWRCTVVVEDQPTDAYVKLVPTYQIVREVLCALIAQAVGLPVLRPGVVLLDDAPFETSERFAFGTVATPEQSLSRSMRDDSVLRSQLSRWTHLALAIAFDEWIANNDRTVRNLLFRGASDFVLIDHGEAIPSGMAVDGSVPNLLARLAYADVNRDELGLATRRVQDASVAFDEIDMTSIQTASLAEYWDADGRLSECCRFLTDRLVHLDDLIARSLGVGQRNLPLRSNRGAAKT